MDFEFGLISAKRVQEINEMKIPSNGVGMFEYYEASEWAYYAHSEDEGILFFEGFRPIPAQIMINMENRPIYIFIYMNEWYHIDFCEIKTINQKAIDGVENRIIKIRVKKNEKLEERTDRDKIFQILACMYGIYQDGMDKKIGINRKRNVEIFYEGD